MDKEKEKKPKREKKANIILKSRVTPPLTLVNVA